MTRGRSTAGWTLVELTVVVATIAVLSAIALPPLATYVERGRSGQCAANRAALKTAEAACHADTGDACLKEKTLVKGGYITAFPECPSGGSYVWRWKKPGKFGYPTMGCSKHYWPKNESDT